MALRLAPLFSSSFTICKTKNLSCRRTTHRSFSLFKESQKMGRSYLKPHLLKPTLSRVVQGSSAGAICHVQVAQMGQQGLCAACGTVGSSHMQWGLPKLVSCICLCSTPQQQAHCPLGRRQQQKSLQHVSHLHFLHSTQQFGEVLWLLWVNT